VRSILAEISPNISAEAKDEYVRQLVNENGGLGKLRKELFLS
jgi:hypothetical protein